MENKKKYDSDEQPCLKDGEVEDNLLHDMSLNKDTHPVKAK